MSETNEDASIVRRYVQAFGTFDPGIYGPMLTDDPVYHFGMTTYHGRDAYHENTGAGKVLYPFGEFRVTERRCVAEDGWVAMLIEREAISNTLAHYENTYTMFFEVADGRIATQVEILDGQVASEKFDLSHLASDHFTPGVTAPPVQRAELPADDNTSESANAKRAVVSFLDAFLSFEADRFEPLLLEDPLYQFGVNRKFGRAAFREIAAAGRILYPDGIAGRTHHVLISNGTTVATLLSIRAKTNKGVDYENLYGMFFDVHEGRITSMIEIPDAAALATAFDLSVLG